MNNFNSISCSKVTKGLALALVLPALSATLVHATPYASELSVSGGVVSFTLNESADSVKILFGSTTTNLGALAKGSYSTNVGAAGTVFVEATKNSAAGWRAAAGSNFTHTVNGVSIVESWAGNLQISDDANPFTRYPAPRGVAVNKNPASPFFGRVYVANSTPGTTAGRSVGRGLYTMKADLSDSPNAYDNAAQNGGLTNWNFANSANAPLRLTVGSDDHVYVSDFSDGSSIVPRLNPNLTFGELVLDFVGGPTALPMGQNHGSTKRVVATGSLAGGDLKIYTLDEDYTGDCMSGTVISDAPSIWVYDIGAGPLTNTSCGNLIGKPSPSWQATQTQDFALGANGYLYAIQNRSAGGEPGLYVLELATGTTVWDSRTAWQQITGVPGDSDILVNLHSVAIDADNQFLAINLLATGNPSGSDCWIIPLVNGIPNLAGRTVLDSGAVTQGRDVAFDRAGNLYTLSSGDAILRAFSPGGFTVAKTGTDGSFSVELPATKVSVAVDQNSITEGGSAVFTITRAGATAAPLSVNFSFAGSAINGSDYSTLSGSVVLNAGDISTNITLTTTLDGISETTEDVVLSLAASPNYTLEPPSSAAVSIIDKDPPAIRVRPWASSMYERHTNDYAGVRIERLGDTDTSITINLANIIFAGAAVRNSDYAVLDNAFPVSLDPGVLSTTVNLVSPLDDGLYTGNKSIVVGSAAAGGLAGSSETTTLTILDDENPPETLLYSNPLNSAADAVNWNVTYANADMPGYGGTDYEATFGYDLVADPLAVGPIDPPPNGSTKALRVTVNKANAKKAGVNFYPKNSNLSGDYAVRFNMNVVIDPEHASSTHGPLFGINHDGAQTNWWAGSGAVVGGPWASDGLWYWISPDGGSAVADYMMFTGVGGTLPNTGWERTVNAVLNDFVNKFKGPPAPYSGYAGPGLIGNDLAGMGGNTATWTDVEIKQVGRQVTMYLNKTKVLAYSNSTSFTSGSLMLGYCDPYDSLGTPAGAAYFSNLRVVRLGPPQVASIVTVGSNVTIKFTSADGTDSAQTFKVQSSSNVDRGYTDNTAATITQLNDGTYQATVPMTGPVHFYRIAKTQ